MLPETLMLMRAATDPITVSSLYITYSILHKQMQFQKGIELYHR